MKFKSNLSSSYTYEDFDLSFNNHAKENLHVCIECYEDKVVKLNMLTGKRIKDIKAWNLKVSLCPPFLL